MMDSANTRTDEQDEATIASNSFPEPGPVLGTLPMQEVPSAPAASIPGLSQVPDPTQDPVLGSNEPQPPNHASITRLAYEIWISGGQKTDNDKANWRSAEITLWTEYVHQMDECHDSPGRVSFGKITR